MRRFPENPIRKLLDYMDSRGDLSPHERERVLKEFLGVPAHLSLSDPDAGLVIKITTDGQHPPEVIRLSELVRLWVAALHVADTPGVGEQVRLILNQLASESITLSEAVSLIVPLVVEASEAVSVDSTGVTLEVSGVRVDDHAWLAESVRLILVSFVSASESVSLTEAVQLLILAAAVEASESVSVDSSGVSLLRNLLISETVVAGVSELLELISPPIALLDATADAQVADGARAALNYGDWDQMWVGYDPVLAFNARSYLQFDLSSIPAGAAIVWGKLLLTPTDGDVPFGPFSVHRVNAAWVENTITWNNQPAFEGAEETDFSVPELGAPTDIDITELVRDWQDGTLTNNGLVVSAAALQEPIGRFATKEWPYSVAQRPKLEVAWGTRLSAWEREAVRAADGGVTLQLLPIGTPESLGLLDDTYVANGTQATQNFGSSTGLLAGFTPAGFSGRTLFHVDLSALPEGAVVTSATLEAYCYGSFSQSPIAIEARSLTSAWNAGSVTWNNQPGNVAVGGASVNVGAFGWYSWNVLADVSDWLAGVRENFGLMLLSPTESGPAKWFYSLNHTDPALRPRLNVTYHT